MSNLLYFDAFNGVAGDMILGALLDLGLPFDYLQSELKKLDVGGYELSAEVVEKGGLSGTNFRVILQPENSQAGEAPIHGRTFGAVQELIRSSSLNGWVAEHALAIFSRLAAAEARVHNRPIGEVHFHEVGAVDAMVDIVGACIGFHYFGISQFFSSALPLGGGTVTFSHGTWPVPAPATVELIAGFPSRLGGVEAELTTPTGAAIVTTLVEAPGVTPNLRLEKVGFGAGDRDVPGIPNMLRLVLGQVLEPTHIPGEQESAVDVRRERVVLLQASIDDMEAELSGHFMETALNCGALDVFFTPIQMKKSRPGLLLTVLCLPDDQDKMVELVFRETTTLGLRVIPQERWVLDREILRIDTEFGSVRIKLGRFGGEVVNVAPEYEDLRSIANHHGLSLKQVRKKVMDHLAELKL